MSRANPIFKSKKIAYFVIIGFLILIWCVLFALRCVQKGICSGVL